MKTATKKEKKCDKGHTYYKSSDCPVCPICEEKRNTQTGFYSTLAAPARRALENKGITTLELLSTFSEAEILQLHGMGPSTLPKLRVALKQAGLAFKNKL